MKKTKIVCTMGPQENDIDLLSRMIEAGMDVARFNFSHGTHEEQAERMESVRKARERTGRPIAMLLDTKGPEIRTGLLVDHKKVTLEAGKEIILTTEDIDGTAEKVSITYKKLYEDVKAGDTILVDDGLIPVFHIAHDAMADVAGEQLLVERIDGGVDRGRLRENIGTVGVLFQHALEAADLSLDAAEPVEELFALLVGAQGVLLSSAAAGFGFFVQGDPSVSKDTPWGYSYTIPLRGICQ